MFKKVTLLCALCLAGSSAAAYDYTDNQPWSVEPPADLRPAQVPLFISIGFDDNRNKEGMDWITNYMRNLNNPAGTANSATFDGSPARFSFYNTAAYLESGDRDPIGVKTAWRNAWLDGHEMGNHTHSHTDGGHDGSNFTQAQWEQEIVSTQDWLIKPYDPNETQPDDTKGPGLPLSELIGFRTPFLDYNNNLFPVLKKHGFVYDTSIEEGWDDNFNGTNNPWPYTMNNGTPTVRVNRPAVGNYPGLWQLPTNVFEKPEGGKMVGFDTNMWVGRSMSKQQVLEILKHNLHLRLEGNRSPLLIGAHSGIYSADYDTGGRATTYIERQQAFEEFIQYALNLEVNGQKVVRIVPFNKIIDWMRAPAALANGNVITVEKTGAGPVWQQGTIYHKGDQVYYQGQPYEARWYADSAPGSVPADYDAWKAITLQQATKLNIGGTILPATDGYGDILVPAQTSQTVQFVPNTGYKVLRVILNGVDIGAPASYTFSNMSKNHQIKVEFAPQ